MRSTVITTVLRLVASLTLAFTAVAGTMAPANAGPFEDASAYLGAKYKVPDFKFKESEFGPDSWFNIVRLTHLGLEIIVEKKKGAYIVYVPATGARKVFSDAGNGYSEPTQTREMWETCGPGSWFITTVGTNPENNKWCVPAHLVGKSGGLTEIGTIAATARKCTFDAGKDGFDVHSC